MFHNEGKPGVIEVGFPRGWKGDLMNFTARNAQNHVKFLEVNHWK